MTIQDLRTAQSCTSGVVFHFNVLMQNFDIIRRATLFVALAWCGSAAVAGAQSAAPLPRKYAGPPTVAEITASDLMTRVYKFADDSLMGRQVGSVYNDMGTAYIESEVRRLGLQPAGDNGTYFQKVPIYSRRLDSASTVTAEGMSFKAGTDFVAPERTADEGFMRPLESAQVVFVGAWVDTTTNIPADSVRGKVLIFTPGGLPQGANTRQFIASNGFAKWSAMRAAAAGYFVVAGEALPPSALRVAFANTAPILLQDTVRVSATITRAMAEGLLGAPPSEWKNRMVGKTLKTSIQFIDTSLPGAERGSHPARFGSKAQESVCRHRRA